MATCIDHSPLRVLSLLVAIALHTGVLLALFLLIVQPKSHLTAEVPIVMDLASVPTPELVPPKLPPPRPKELAPPDPSQRTLSPPAPTTPAPPVSSSSASAPSGPPVEASPTEPPAAVEPDYLPQFKIDQLPQFPTQQILSRVVYPPLAAAQGLEVTVILELSIDKDGVIRKIVVLKDPGFGFSEAAVKALSGIQVVPAQAGGQTVAVRYRYPIRFTLK